MKQFAGFVTGFSRLLDRLAGLCLVSVMVLIVTNILSRSLLKRPILGTYEFAGYLTAAVIGLALAYCAVQNGHIAVTFVVDRLPRRAQACVDAAMNLCAFLFWVLAAWHLGSYAHSMAVNGVVSPTTQMPFYYFIYLIALGLLALCLVLLVKTIESIKKVVLHR